jgi:hypothetical protein
MADPHENPSSFATSGWVDASCLAHAAPTPPSTTPGIAGPYAILISPNGTTWTPVASPFSFSQGSVVWAEELGLFAATAMNQDISSPPSQFAASSDGRHWGAVTSTPTTPALNDNIGFAPSIPQFLSFDGNTTSDEYISGDGTSWTLSSVESGSDVEWAEDWSEWIGVGRYYLGPGPNDYMAVVTSPDAATWTIQTTPFQRGGAVGYSHELGVAVVHGIFSDISGNYPRLMASVDGVGWSDVTPFATPTWQGKPCWAAGLGAWFLLGAPNGTGVGFTGWNVYTSTDGFTWTVAVALNSTTYPSGMRNIRWSEDLGQLLMVGRINNQIFPNKVATSPDGVTWTLHDLPDRFNVDYAQFENPTWSPTRHLWVLLGASFNASPSGQLGTSPYCLRGGGFFDLPPLENPGALATSEFFI